MSHSKMNPDIKEERDKVSFPVEEFVNLYHRGADKVAEKRLIGEYSYQMKRKIHETTQN